MGRTRPEPTIYRVNADYDGIMENACITIYPALFRGAKNMLIGLVTPPAGVQSPAEVGTYADGGLKTTFTDILYPVRHPAVVGRHVLASLESRTNELLTALRDDNTINPGRHEG